MWFTFDKILHLLPRSENRTGRGEFCISATKWFKRGDAGSFISLWQCHTVVGKGREQPSTRNTGILLGSGHARLSCWLKPAAAAKAASFGESTRWAQKTSSQGRCWIQGRISAQKVSAFGGFSSQHISQLPHKPQFKQWNPSQEGHLRLKCHWFKSRLSSEFWIFWQPKHQTTPTRAAPITHPLKPCGHTEASPNLSFLKPSPCWPSWAVTWRHLQYLKIIFSRSKGYSMIPVVGTLTRSTSCWVGRYPGVAIRSTSLR